MNEEYTEYKKRLDELCKKVDELRHAREEVRHVRDMIKFRGYYVPNQVNDLDEELTRKIVAAEEFVYEIGGRIQEIRKNCQHNWVYVGHDSHHDFYNCTICGETLKD